MIEAFQLEYDAMNKPGALHEYLKKEREDKQNQTEKEAKDKADKEADKRKQDNKWSNKHIRFKWYKVF